MLCNVIVQSECRAGGPACSGCSAAGREEWPGGLELWATAQGRARFSGWFVYWDHQSVGEDGWIAQIIIKHSFFFIFSLILVKWQTGGEAWCLSIVFPPRMEVSMAWTRHWGQSAADARMRAWQRHAWTMRRWRLASCCSPWGMRRRKARGCKASCRPARPGTRQQQKETFLSCESALNVFILKMKQQICSSLLMSLLY